MYIQQHLVLQQRIHSMRSIIYEVFQPKDSASLAAIPCRFQERLLLHRTVQISLSFAPTCILLIKVWSRQSRLSSILQLLVFLLYLTLKKSFHFLFIHKQILWQSNLQELSRSTHWFDTHRKLLTGSRLHLELHWICKISSLPLLQDLFERHLVLRLSSYDHIHEVIKVWF